MLEVDVTDKLEVVVTGTLEVVVTGILEVITGILELVVSDTLVVIVPDTLELVVGTLEVVVTGILDVVVTGTLEIVTGTLEVVTGILDVDVTDKLEVVVTGTGTLEVVVVTVKLAVHCPSGICSNGHGSNADIGNGTQSVGISATTYSVGGSLGDDFGGSCRNISGLRNSVGDSFSGARLAITQPKCNPDSNCSGQCVLLFRRQREGSVDETAVT
ncbi:hypothetical protein DTO013E5_4072 [Penicillium roqueforti]|nr:hypothetical protein CBS147337_2913 [Penicillium roqueforti]KAI2690489.1 hypothetical protein CBS147355_940 [Penicillium roqueforti]KAI2729858.1 hypothetical protein CBS147354_1243 [Penicillium roqueforti]KAI2748259.1 hypothetical protein DTO012A1_905 [Penicillium roqueforti]KAI3114869.1 hypothetical protein CBS147333_2024 [Penicillium roqueforti]